MTTKKEIIEAFRKEGLNPSYQGKTKTIFVDSLPTGITLINAEKAGFNVTKREVKQ